MADEEKLIQAHTSPEHKGHYEVGETAGEQLKKLEKEKSAETGETETSQQETAERAREKVEQEAVFAKETGLEGKTGGEPEASSRPSSVTTQEKQAEYKKTMQSIRTQMSKPGRGFSKTIHQPAVEATSQAVGTSVARPNAILAGSLFAFIAVLGVYLLARYNGFPLSGFETIAAFAVGWLVGVVLDLLRVTFYRRRTV